MKPSPIKPLTLLTLLAALTIILSCSDEKAPTAPAVNLPDYRPPTVEWLAPSAEADLRGVVTLRLSVTDDSSVARVAVYRNGTSPAEWQATGNVEFGDSTYAFTWNTLDFPDAYYTLEARAWDQAGNLGVSPILCVQVLNDTTADPGVDLTPPVILWLSPDPGDTLEGDVTLQFRVTDESPLDSVQVFRNGEKWQNLKDMGNYFDGDVRFITSEVPDGIYIIQIKAVDSAGNVALSEVLWFTVWNNRPRVIWVPDEFETIQGAIDNSYDGDTIRVRPGTYREGLRLYSKSIWLESEMGPEQTIINATGIDTSAYAGGIWVEGERTCSTIRGFTVKSEDNGIATINQVSLNIYNCILYDDSHRIVGIFLSRGNCSVLNCIIDGAHRGAFVSYVSGRFYNTMFFNCDVGYYKLASFEYWIDYGWNLFWNNVEDYRYETAKESDIFENPRFIPDSYIPSQNSPAIDNGNPGLLDKDGSRSDIGIYGGLYSY